MTKLTRLCGSSEMVQMPRTAAQQGWIVISGSSAARPVSRQTVARSGLRLVEPRVTPVAGSQSEVRKTFSPTKARWLKAVWLAGAVASGWALYWVSLAA